MTQMMSMSLLMWMRYKFVYVVPVSVYLKPQGLLDDGDSAIEDGEIESKVSVSVALSVYSLCRLPLRIVW